MTNKRDDLRALLEKIAATAGDPPEHGLDGVKARRRRRTRHRRGAVATAMALAVGGFVTVSWLSGVRNGHDVAAGSALDGSSREEPKLPDTLEMICSTERLDVPIASIGTRSDGLHVHIVNKRGIETDIWLLNPAAGWKSGRFSVGKGSTDVVLSAPPGTLTVGCEGGLTTPQRQVDLVDAGRHYEATRLSCPANQVKPLKGPITGRSIDMPTAVRRALGDARLRASQLRPHSGYSEENYDIHSLDPTVEVRRHGDIVALVHLTGTVAKQALDAPKSIAPSLEAPWTGVRQVDYCPGWDAPPGAGGGTDGRSPS